MSSSKPQHQFFATYDFQLFYTGDPMCPNKRSWFNIAFGVMLCQSLCADLITALVCFMPMTEAQLKDGAKLAPEQITPRTAREHATRHLLTFLMKVWLMVNTEERAAYDITVLAFIVQSGPRILEALYWRTTDWREEAGEIVAFDVVGLGMMIWGRGSFQEHDLDWAVKWSPILGVSTVYIGAYCLDRLQKLFIPKPVVSAGTQTDEVSASNAARLDPPTSREHEQTVDHDWVSTTSSISGDQTTSSSVDTSSRAATVASNIS